MHALRVILAFSLAFSMAACSSKPKRTKNRSSDHSNAGVTGTSPTRRASSTPSGTAFLTALGRIEAGDATRKVVRFSDTTALNGLGAEWKALAGYGTHSASPGEGYGINHTTATYAVTAGTGPIVTVLAGGQDPATVQAALTAKGWTADGDRLIAPKQSADRAAGVYPVVRAIGSDVLIGSAGATLDVVSAARSLAGDPVPRSLADCLGGVVVAHYASTATGAVAVGTLRPSSDAKIHAVVCSAAASPAAAEQSAAAQRTAYGSGTAPLANATVTVTGSVVRVDGVVTGPKVVLDAFTRSALPGL
ncbi:hypothetical protein [Dactylosporangium maewongense]|uniref:hypothetical protein n=1 Tax=Dactylosporangium maewongense TaxID=634393 RepID=UPI0031E18EC3